jgi:hypothetical protein
MDTADVSVCEEDVMSENSPPLGRNERRSGRRGLAIAIVIVLLIAAVIALRGLFSGNPQDADVAPVDGEVTVADDFYHALDGTWKMETTIHLLKEQKYVSSDDELKYFLVYTANPGEIVRISQAEGRWKFLDVMQDGKVKASGWADAEDHRAELQADPSSVQPGATSNGM